MRLQRALDGFALAGVAAAACAGLWLLRVRLGAHDDRLTRALLWSALALPVLGALALAARRIEALTAATKLDRAHGLHALVASAWEFTALPAEQRSAFMQATVADAQRLASSLSARRAQPLHAPAHLPALILLLLGLAALSRLHVPQPSTPTKLQRPQLQALLASDDLQGSRAELAALTTQRQLTPLARETSERLTQLLGALSERQVDRAQALAQLQTLHDALARDRHDDAAIRDALHALQDGFSAQRITQRLAQALADNDRAAVQAQLQQLAARARADKPDARTLQALRDALHAASQRLATHTPRPARPEGTEQASLLHTSQDRTAATPAERSLLEQKKRELDQLLRQEREQRAMQRELEQLQRDLEQASQAMQEQPKTAAEQLDRSAQDIEQLQQHAAGAQTSKALQERLAQLQELIRRQRPGQGSQQQRAAQQREQARAQSQGQAQSQSANGQALTLQHFREQAGANSDKQTGHKPGSRGLLMEAPGQEAGNISLPGAAQSASEHSNQPGDTDSTQLRMQATHGPGAGDGRPHSAAPSSLSGQSVDSRVEGQAGHGPTRSEVIFQAAQRGFASKAYEQVHTDYEHYAQSELERDQIPGGYRFYVRRYFQLIRPRQTPQADTTGQP